MRLNMFVSTTYNRLLADVSRISKVPLGAPDVLTYDWAYIDGPKLDKELLLYLEGNGPEPVFPEWLNPLWLAFVREDRPLLLGFLRQLLVFCYKTEQNPTYEQLRSAQADFEETDAGVAVWDSHFSDRPHCHTTASARRIVGSIIYRINWSEITPSHGPGGVYPPRHPCYKSCFRTLYRSIQDYYPYDQHFGGLPSFWVDLLMREKYGKIVEENDIIAKLVAVPKDSRGPRLICVHPAESIWIQQGQRQLLEARISSHPITKGKISFKDQTVNGDKALSSSKTRELVTLDLKEASDRISCKLVRYLFGDHAYNWMSCSRANKVKLLDGRVIELKKWAPMGNALCFPVESLIFFSLVTAAIESVAGRKADHGVYVFGDDIIFPSQYMEVVIRCLSYHGLVPNMQKTFRNGFFRESCGVDAYKGTDITPLRLRKDNVRTFDAAESICNLALRAKLRGFDACATWLYRNVRQFLASRRLNLPIVNNPEAGGFFEYQPIPLTELVLRERSLLYIKRWHRWSVPRWAVTGRQFAVREGEWFHLQDSLLRLIRESTDTSSSDTLSDRGTEYADPRRTRLVRGWTTLLLE